MRPVVLTANTPRSFYRGTGRIHRFRGLPAPADEYHPEDWIASTTARFGSAPLGLTTLPDGRDLAAAIADEPEAWLGAAHVQRYGADPALVFNRALLGGWLADDRADSNRGSPSR